jgi:hypothetical protein
VCRSVYRLSDKVADLLPSQLPKRERQLSIRQIVDPPREETEVHGHTDSNIQFALLPIITSDNTANTTAQPILIPTTPAGRRAPNRIQTPVSGRGDRQGHLFPIKGSSPTRLSHLSTRKSDHSQTLPPPPLDHPYRQRSFSLTLSPPPRAFAMMHADRGTSRYTPTSPLSPRLEGASRPISPQPTRARQTSRPMNIPIPKYHPAQFQQRDLPGNASSSSHNPIINYTKHTSTTESPRLMKERQRELIDKAKMSSRIAASPYGVKPEAPRLDPLGSPKGPVTPLALEEGTDYFLVAGSGEHSPSLSPGSRSEGSIKDVGDAARVKKATKKDGSCR